MRAIVPPSLRPLRLHTHTHTCHRRGAILVLGYVMSHLEKGEHIVCPRRDESPLSASVTVINASTNLI
jgi:hypothetical protein